MLYDILVGCCAGMTQVMVGHPFDTAKVLLQNKQSWRGLMLKDYYRGGFSALPNAITKNSIVMPVYCLARKNIDSDIIAGSIAGLSASPTQYIFDFMKIKKQTYQKYNIMDIIYNRGKAITATKETLGFALYFKSFYYCRKDLELSAPISGGVSGLSLWSILFPLDTIKTRQISQDISIKDALKQGKLYNGFLPCVTRSILVNSALWTVVDTMKGKKNRYIYIKDES